MQGHGPAMGGRYAEGPPRGCTHHYTHNRLGQASELKVMAGTCPESESRVEAPLSVRYTGAWGIQGRGVSGVGEVKMRER